MKETKIYDKFFVCAQAEASETREKKKTLKQTLKKAALLCSRYLTVILSFKMSKNVSRMKNYPLCLCHLVFNSKFLYSSNAKLI